MPSPAPIQPLVDRLLTDFTQLLETLEAERAALTERSPEALERVVPAKETLCAQIARDQQTLLGALGHGPAAEPEGMGTLRELARRCRSENAVNGRIVNRARQTNKTLLGLLTGEPGADLYQPAGHDLPVSARPSTGHRLGSA